MALDVNVTIKLSKGAGAVGFGVPLILISGQETAIAYNEYASADAVAAAGYAETSDAYKLFTIMKAQDNAPARIGIMQTDGTAVAALPSLLGKVRQVVAVLGSKETAATVAEYIEGTDSLTYFPIVSASGDLASFTGYDRTLAGVHSGGQILAAALVGATAGYSAGEFTYKNMILRGITPDSHTELEIDTIDNTAGTQTAYGYTVQTKAGDVVTTEGRAASGQFMDITDSFDWVIQNIEHDAQKLMNNSPKLPYDDRGIGALEAVVNNVLKEADNNGMIAHGDSGEALYSTAFGSRSDSTEADRAARNYKLGTFTFTLAGAIHTAAINGTVTV